MLKLFVCNKKKLMAEYFLLENFVKFLKKFRVFMVFDNLTEIIPNLINYSYKYYNVIIM